MGRGWIQDIKDMVKIEKDTMTMPWAMTTNASPSPGICFFSAGGVPMQPPKYKTQMILPATASMEAPMYGDLDENEPPTVLIFELDGWSIERYKGTPKGEVDWISHYCPVYGWRYNTDMWCIMADGVCNQCCEEIPEEVIAVWKLKNFDYLPSEEVAKSVLSGDDIGYSYP